ncbi:hypothetical protein BBJ29_008511 [Phytophthora kernoviae]|uniref:BZIP domain-containing protein n=1 Tax=Phytophthora kernoviae TaxID=325452 RepID=A0A3F2RVV7_9STRA|nr:hypothetical protein BBJ29_008511 [Phytophthora kernoviae]RLN64396.1 hypothetical protein BBP00_00003490 [Phytophthora kernoviae]
MVGAQLTPEELHRRERNRSKVRRSYYRKIFNLNELRAQVDTLEDKYEHLLQMQEKRSAFHASQSLTEPLTEAESLLDLTLEPLEDLEALDEMEPIEPLPVAMEPPVSREKRLLHLARVRKGLYEENESLRSRGMEFAKAYGSLQHLVDVRTEDDELENAESKRTQLMVWRRFAIAECLEINRVAYRRIMDYIEKQRHRPHKGTTLGWTDRRRLSDGVMSYCFSKFFAKRSSAELAETTWKLATDVKRMGCFFSVYLHVNMHAVQRVDMNNVVCLRTVNQADHDVVVKSLFLLTRFETEKGIIMLMHGLDPSRVENDFTMLDMVGKAEVWQDDFRWVLFEGGTNGCHMSYGGFVLVDHPWEQFWLCEVLLLTLRWESAVVAPLFTLRAN